MTSRAVLAAAVPVLPLLAGLAVAVLPSQRAGERLALVIAAPTALLALITSAWALIAADRPLLGDWLCVDAAGGVLVGVIGLVGAASLAVSPTYLATAPHSLFSGRRPRAHYYTALLVFWAALLAVPLAANLGAAWLLVEATTAASALLVAFSGKAACARGRLEVPRPHLARPGRGAAGPARAAGRPAPRRRAGRALVHEHPRRRARARPSTRPARLPPPAGRAGRQDRLGARAQLASRRPLRGARAGLRAALGRAAPGRAARRLARPAGARRRRRRGHRAPRVHLLRPGLAGRGGAVPVAPAGLEAAARLLQPRAHGRDRARHRLRPPARARRRRSCTSPGMRSPSRSGSTPPCRSSACSHRPRPTRRAAWRAPTRAWEPSWASAWRRSRACRRRRCSSPS